MVVRLPLLWLIWMTLPAGSVTLASLPCVYASVVAWPKGLVIVVSRPLASRPKVVLLPERSVCESILPALSNSVTSPLWVVLVKLPLLFLARVALSPAAAR